MIREFNEQWEKDCVRKTVKTLEDQTVRRKSVAEQNSQREDIDEVRYKAKYFRGFSY
jgi:hypothetical protein